MTPSSSTPAWGVLIISGTLAIFAAAFSSADRNVQFFGKNQQGLRELRSTGNVIPARVLTVATEAQGENGHVFIRLRLDVAPPAGPLFRTSTSTRITATDVPRFQPGQMLPVRHLPKSPRHRHDRTGTHHWATAGPRARCVVRYRGPCRVFRETSGDAPGHAAHPADHIGYRRGVGFRRSPGRGDHPGGVVNSIPVPPHHTVPAEWRRPYRRALTDPANGKHWSIAVDGSTTSRSGPVGRERFTERGHASPDAAMLLAGNEALKRLRKGMILRASGAETGEQLLQISVGSGYTDALPVAAAGRTVYTTDGTGSLIAVDAVSGVHEVMWNPAGKELIWQVMCPAPVGGVSAQVVARTDNLIQLLGAGDWRIQDDWLADSAVAGGLLLTASHGTRCLTVRQIIDGVTLERIPVEPQLYGGHTPMLRAALSADASMLAWCDSQSSVQVQRIGGETVRSVPIPPGLVERVKLSSDGSMLFAAIASDGGMQIAARDTRTAAPLPGWDDVVSHRLDFATGNGEVAVLADSVVTVRDYGGGTLTAFPLDNVVHRAGIAWHGGDLAVRTDSGCLSLYAVRR